MSEIHKHGYAQRKPLIKGDPIRDKIVIARHSMLEKFPFFGYIAMHLEPLETTEVPTMAVTGDRKFLINREFVEKISTKELMWGLAHESLHIASESCYRMPPGGNTIVWNWASDVAINYKLSNPEKGAGLDIPTSFQPLYGQKFAKYDNKSTEAIYYDMIQNNFSLGCSKCSSEGKKKKNKKKEGEQGNQPSKGNSEHSHSGSEKECNHWYDDSGSRVGDAAEEEKEAWKNIVAQAAEAARSVGKLPGALQDFVTELLQPKKDWRRELASFVGSYCKKKYDWKVRNRRTASTGIITPGMSPHLPKGVCGIDTSGSMSDPNIRRAISEHAAILDASGGEGILGLFDCVLYYYGDVDVEAVKRLPVQRGDTDFRPFFEKIEEEVMAPAYAVIFTDLCGPWPENSPAYPVVICKPKGLNVEPPWPCRVIEIDFD